MREERGGERGRGGEREAGGMGFLKIRTLILILGVCKNPST